jgi:hypothetical protein
LRRRKGAGVKLKGPRFTVCAWCESVRKGVGEQLMGVAFPRAHARRVQR